MTPTIPTLPYFHRCNKSQTVWHRDAAQQISFGHDVIDNRLSTCKPSVNRLYDSTFNPAARIRPHLHTLQHLSNLTTLALVNLQRQTIFTTRVNCERCLQVWMRSNRRYVSPLRKVRVIQWLRHDWHRCRMWARIYWRSLLEPLCR